MKALVIINASSIALLSSFVGVIKESAVGCFWVLTPYIFFTIGLICSGVMFHLIRKVSADKYEYLLSEMKKVPKKTTLDTQLAEEYIPKDYLQDKKIKNPINLFSFFAILSWLFGLISSVALLVRML